MCANLIGRWGIVRSRVLDIAFLSVGMYQAPLPPQNGAPLRLTLPWKFGFKSSKYITRITFVAERPRTFWSVAGPAEYGFWANVNPQVPHRRWSQASERELVSDTSGRRIPTQLFNGYANQVGHLYTEIDDHENIYY